MLSKKKWLVGSILILCGIIVLFYTFNKNKAEEVLLYSQVNFKDINNTESWESFKKEINITNAQIEDFQMILDDKNHIYSVKLNLVKKNNDTYTLHRYDKCNSCELPEENEVFIRKNKVSEWENQKLLDADIFFSVLDILKDQGFFDNKRFKYKLIATSGLNEEIALEGDYYQLKHKSLRKLANLTNEETYSGYNLQVIGNDLPEEFGTSDETTQSVIFDTVFK